MAALDGEKIKTTKIVILTQNNEMEIASVLYRLIVHFDSMKEIKKDIIVLDNCSEDRTIEIMHQIGIETIRFKKPRKKMDVVKRALELGKTDRKDTLVMLDITGGNDAEDAISLIGWSKDEGDRFASAYIYPPRKGSSIGCWAIDDGLLGIEVDPGMNIEGTLLEMASKSDLELLAVRENIVSRSKKRKTYLLNMIPRSPIGVIAEIVKYHPLMFYGGLGALSVLLAIGSGIYTINYFIRYEEISYFPAIVTATLFIIGGFLLVAGLILNALNVLAEKLEAMRKWMD